MQKLLDNNFKVYIIGGAVRDHYKNIEPHDYDLFTNATGDNILKLFPNSNIIGGEERQKKILTVIVDNIEISQFRKSGDRTEVGNTLEEHQKTCDFNMNAIPVDINGNVIFNEISKRGIFEIENNFISFVGDVKKRVEEDKSRLLRALRFIDSFDLQFRFNNEKIFIENSNLNNIPPENIRDNLIKIINSKNGIEILHKFNFLKEIIPELYHKNHFKNGGKYHNETPFEHMMQSFKEACKITADYRIKLAALLHDIGKGETRADYDNNIHFYNHQNVGAEIVKRILKKLIFPNDDINFITTLVKTHMFGYKEDIQDKTYVKFYSELQKSKVSIYDFLILVYCDRQANFKKVNYLFGDFCNESNKKFLLYNYNRIKSKSIPFTIKDLKISGKDLILLGLKPGLNIGMLLDHVYESVLDGKLKNEKGELMYYVRNVLKNGN